MQRTGTTLSGLAALAAAGALALTVGEALAEEIPFTELPAPVQRSVENLAPGIAPRDFSVLREKGKTYEVSYNRKGVSFEVSLTPDGKVFRIEEAVSYRPLPSSPRNERISRVASLSEDLVDYALIGATDRVKRTLTRMKKELPGLRKDVGKAVYNQLSDQMKTMEARAAKGDLVDVALVAVDAYRTLELSLDVTALIIPREVSMLDYSGFRLKTMAQAKPVDWKAVGEDVKEAAGYWKSLKDRVTDPGIRDLMNSIQAGLNAAAAHKDLSQLRFAAQLQLDAVDLLERDFATAYKTGPGAVERQKQ